VTVEREAVRGVLHLHDHSPPREALRRATEAAGGGAALLLLLGVHRSFLFVLQLDEFKKSL